MFSYDPSDDMVIVSGIFDDLYFKELSPNQLISSRVKMERSKATILHCPSICCKDWL